MSHPQADMRVLQIIKGLDIGGVHGGAERFSVDLSGELKQRGVEVSICVFFQTGSQTEAKWLQRLESQQIPSFFLTSWKRNDHFGSYLAGIRELKRILSCQPPVLICHSHFQLGTITALYLKAIGCTRRAIRTSHMTKEWSSGLYGWIREQLVSKWLFPLFLDAEVGVSQAVVDQLSSHPGARISRSQPRLIYNAIPADPFGTAEKKSPPQKQPGKRIVGSVGRLTKQKGFRYLIQAAQIVCRHLNDVEFWIIGDGELSEELQAQSVQLGIDDRVRFWGQRGDVDQLLSQMELFVLPSLWEGLPTVIMESFKQGVPVLATDIPGTRELVLPGKTGWLVPPADPNRMASMIELVMNDEEGRRLASSAGKAMVNHFKIDAIANQYLDLYSSLNFDKKVTTQP